MAPTGGMLISSGVGSVICRAGVGEAVTWTFAGSSSGTSLNESCGSNVRVSTRLSTWAVSACAVSACSASCSCSSRLSRTSSRLSRTISRLFSRTSSRRSASRAPASPASCASRLSRLASVSREPVDSRSAAGARASNDSSERGAVRPTTTCGPLEPPLEAAAFGRDCGRLLVGDSEPRVFLCERPFLMSPRSLLACWRACVLACWRAIAPAALPSRVDRAGRVQTSCAALDFSRAPGTPIGQREHWTLRTASRQRAHDRPIVFWSSLRQVGPRTMHRRPTCEYTRPTPKCRHP